MPLSQQPPPIDEPSTPGSRETPIVREYKAIKARLVSEATSAVSMVESAIRSLFESDIALANEILDKDERIDMEEVAIEEQIFRLMALQAPVAKDFRSLAFALKANADIERVADHACSICKVTLKLDPAHPLPWPTALREMGERVPIMCHALIRAFVNEDPEAAKEIIVADKTINALHKKLFDETVGFMERGTHPLGIGLRVYRVGRELERIGDLMVSIAEDIVYMTTGEIIRHQKKMLRAGER